MASDDRARRSANMARIRGKNTAPELVFRKALWRRGLRYRVHLKVEGARPDIVFPSHRLVVFIDGCFWHGCPMHYVRPRSRPEFWANKLTENTNRDRSQTVHLIERGWRVLRFWEHEVDAELNRAVDEVAATLRQPPVQFGNRAIVVRVEAAAAESDMECWHIEDLLNTALGYSEMRPRRPQ